MLTLFSIRLTAGCGAVPHSWLVMTLRRFNGLVVVLAMAQLSLARAPLVCESHHAATTPVSVSHGGMTMADAPGRGAGGHVGEVPTGELPPCDHQGAAGDCASMSSCRTVTAEAPSTSQRAVAANARVTIAVIVAHASTSPSPETPPPRA